MMYQTNSENFHVDLRLSKNLNNTNLFWTNFADNPNLIVDSEKQIQPWGFCGFAINKDNEVDVTTKPRPRCPPPRCYVPTIENFVVDNAADIVVFSANGNETERWKAYPIAGSTDKFAFLPLGPTGLLEYPVTIQLTTSLGNSSAIIFNF